MWALNKLDGTIYPAKIKAYKDSSKYIIDLFLFSLGIMRPSRMEAMLLGMKADPRWTPYFGLFFCEDLVP